MRQQPQQQMRRGDELRAVLERVRHAGAQHRQEIRIQPQLLAVGHERLMRPSSRVAFRSMRTASPRRPVRWNATPRL